MFEPAVADRVEVLVLVDNVTDNLSTAPAYVENEWPRLWKKGMRRLSGRCLCCGAHGLSCAITAWRGESARTLLFDTGPDASVFERNVDRLGFDVASIDGIVLSHGHWDHCGAMLRALEMIQLGTGGRAVPTYMHPGMYRTRAVKERDGSMRAFEDTKVVNAGCSGSALMIFASGLILTTSATRPSSRVMTSSRSMFRASEGRSLRSDSTTMTSMYPGSVVLSTSCATAYLRTADLPFATSDPFTS
jgi:metal-dependent hydrolase (beta-lactamase superfamily II)